MASEDFERSMIEKIRSVVLNPCKPHRYWSWHDPSLPQNEQKRVAEKSVTRQFCEALEAKAGRKLFKSVTSCLNDRPDCLALTMDDKRIGFEVTELLDKEYQKQMVEMWRRRILIQPRYWKPEEIVAGIAERVAAKQKEFQGEPYHSRILLIHSREVYVEANFDHCVDLMHDMDFGSDPYHNAAYFIVPPQVPHGVSETQEPQVRFCEIKLNSKANTSSFS
jgi:hypothetical protein